MNNYSQVLKRIKLRREEVDITIDQMAERLGKDRTSYSRKEAGKSKISTEELMQIAEILDVPMSRLFDEDDELTQAMVEDKVEKYVSQQKSGNVTVNISIAVTPENAHKYLSEEMQQKLQDLKALKEE
ncbi:MAG: hypothetical protein CL843_18230 [Crocinitomicaceae bacterium]|nr:hypothetical protein [Crocinitomicaceae bacterium]|tara:strand:- start:183 stop:566 length:384 start_codon:yes stop_codon:yes gene_type:complete